MTRSILITGCSSGIGHDAAHTLRDRGWQVFASCRKPEDCDRLRAEGFASPRLDYEDADSIASTVAEVLEATGGRLDALYNNGAYGIPGLVEDLPRAAFEAILQANLIGPHDLTQQLVPVMRAQGHGRIVNCTSVFGYVAVPWRGAYIATKHGLEGLTDSLRQELHDTGIAVSLIQPGLITTRFGENSGHQMQKWIDWEGSVRAEDYRTTMLAKAQGRSAVAHLEVPPSAVTRKLIHALESPRPRPRYRVTKLAELACVLDRVLPTRAFDWLARRVT
ncbi:SDR family NAD(P)-dependent oxidoreductase [Nioella nitratireducens]|uniref:SDR family NAD(P)-dependent oxidoreductase n=1 Tax=Nioella nitratireducens TaxID=1287720 RepID=UPI0008FD0416|nr:SDR family NAD(P)-dependent oxidoreductase [Nioella nitratireducens]